jgi:DNA-directed RNA polymerase specialized sigma24 family protein
VAEVNTYRVDVDRDGRFWRIHVPQIERSTQARHLREVELMARDLIAIMEDAPPDSFGVDIHIELPEDVRQELARSAELREQAAHAQTEAARLSRDAARRLYDQGLPLRDIGKVLGVSFQRAKQLVDQAREQVA